MKKPALLPHLKLSGSPAEIGLAHGRAFSTRIHDCFTFYTRELCDNPHFDFTAWGLEYLQAVRDAFPDLGEEMDGIALGAKMETWQIGVLNARTEIFLASNAERIAECTALSFPENRLLGQNWDWMTACEPFMVLLEIERPDGRKVLTMTEAGMLGKIGLNNRGLGVCLNILFGTHEKIAVPIHPLLRAILELDNLEEAHKMLEKTSFSSFGNIMIADDRGHCLDLELEGSEFREVTFQGMPVHANNYLTGSKSEQPGMDHVLNSKIRMERAEELADSVEERTITAMKMILGDAHNGKDAICKPHLPMWEKLEHGTICSMIVDLAARVMQITPGNPSKVDYRTYMIE